MHYGGTAISQATPRAQPSTFLSGRTAREAGRRRAGDKDRVNRREDPALAQGADDPSDVACGEKFL
jgi:hypothetical protein